MPQQINQQVDIEDFMFQVESNLKANGFPEWDAPTLQEVHKWMNHPEVQQGIQSGEVSVGRVVSEVAAAVQGMQGGGQQPVPAVPDFAMEGGLINDRSGLVTRQVRGL